MKYIKHTLFVLLCGGALAACHSPAEAGQKPVLPIKGTWKLLSGTLIEKGDTTVTDYTQKLSFIKIINDTHFAFTLHDLNGGKDSTAAFSAGSGAYNLSGDQYVEHLEYCSDRAWEGHDFSFTVEIRNDTLIQRGVEKIVDAGIDRINIEKYVRISGR